MTSTDPTVNPRRMNERMKKLTKIHEAHVLLLVLLLVTKKGRATACAVGFLLGPESTTP
jgi:hypothetical protein